jgi:hypothetical protein
MATDDNRMTDEVSAELNPADDPGPAEGQPDPIPPRPADGAAKAKWVDYCVALGAERAFLLGETEHYDPDAEVTRTRRVPVGLGETDNTDVAYFEDLADLIESAVEDGQSPEDFAERMRTLYETARQRLETPEGERQYREETVTERGGYVKAKALTRDELIELADRLGG